MSKAKKIAVAVGAFVLAAAVGIGIAAFVANAPVTGSATSSQFVAKWTTATPPTVLASNDMTCTVTESTGELRLEANKAYPGGSCTVQGSVYLPGTNAEDGRIVGMSLNLPTGWSVALGKGCDVAMTRDTAYTVEFTVTMGESAAMDGATSTFAPSSDGVQVVPASSNAPLQAGCV